MRNLLVRLTGRRRAILVCAGGILLVLVAGGWWLLSLQPAKPEIEPDSSEAWRELMQNESRPVRLASAILLTAKSDDRGTSALLEMFPSLAPHELSSALDVLVAMADKNRLDPELIDLFLDASNNPQHRAVEVVSPRAQIIHGIGLYQAVRLIPPGGERKHLAALRRGFDRVVAEYNLNVGNPTGATWNVLERLIASGDRETLLHCEKVILSSVRRARSVKVAVSGSFYWHWAPLVLGLHTEDPLAGFQSIEKNCPAECIAGLQRATIRELGNRKHDAELIALWLEPLPDEPQGERPAEGLEWPAIWDVRSKDKSLRLAVAAALAGHWPEIADDQKARLTAADRDQLLLAYARLRERQGKPSTREAFLRLLEEPTGQIIYGIKGMHESGEKDLREILIREAMKTTDIQRARDVLHALHYRLEGIPESVRERWRLLLDQTPDPIPGDPFPQDTAKRKASIKKWINEPTPQKKTATSEKRGEPYRDSGTPWAFRRGRVQYAIRDLRELASALAARFVDYSLFPPGLSDLTSPVGYVKTLPPDICAWSGPYAYAPAAWRIDYAISSAGPDGVHDISLLHFLLTQELTGRKVGQPLERPYVRLSRQGYEFLKTPVPGSDIIAVYDRSIFDKKKSKP